MLQIIDNQFWGRTTHPTLTLTFSLMERERKVRGEGIGGVDSPLKSLRRLEGTAPLRPTFLSPKKRKTPMAKHLTGKVCVMAVGVFLFLAFVSQFGNGFKLVSPLF